MKKLCLSLSFLATTAIFTDVAQSANCSVAGSMIQVKNYKLGAQEIVEFKLKSPATYTKTITAVTGPFEQDPSGEPIPVSGVLFTKVHFQSLDWTCTIPRIFSPKPVVKDVKLIEQFEGYVAYVIGRRAHSHYLGVTDVPCGGYRCVRVKFGP